MNHHSELQAESRRPCDHDALSAPRVIDAPTTLRAFTPTIQSDQSLSVLDVLIVSSVVVCLGLVVGFGVPLLIEAFLIALGAVTGGTIR